MNWRNLGLVTTKRLQFQYASPPVRRQKVWILNMFRFRTTHGNGHHSAKWAFPPDNQSPSITLFILIACYPGIDFFCILHRQRTRYQYTEPWVMYQWPKIANLLPNHHHSDQKYLAAVIEMEAELPATPSQFSLSISLFLLFQGLVPLFWSSISEVKGRKASHFGLVNLRIKLIKKMFDVWLVCVFRVTLLVHHWDHHRGFESQHSIVSQANP